MSLVVGVRFADAGKLYYYDPGPLELVPGDCVLVETARGLELGEVALGPREVEDTNMTSALQRISKRADDQDFRKLEQNVRREEEAYQVCEERIRKREMPMKLIDVEYTFDGAKLIFYFAAEGRVDFRELVKDLAAVFRTRIELRQIGVRDEAKKIGGLGPCGRPACCNAFLEDFVPVSIKMAKEQSLSLSPTKISGLCGRLMCCLHYEHEHYREMHKKLPRVGSYVNTPDGSVEVMDTDALHGRIKARVPLQDGTFELRRYTLEEIGVGADRSRPIPRQEHTPSSDHIESTERSEHRERSSAHREGAPHHPKRDRKPAGKSAKPQGQKAHDAQNRKNGEPGTPKSRDARGHKPRERHGQGAHAPLRGAKSGGAQSAKPQEKEHRAGRPSSSGRKRTERRQGRTHKEAGVETVSHGS